MKTMYNLAGERGAGTAVARKEEILPFRVAGKEGSAWKATHQAVRLAARLRAHIPDEERVLLFSDVAVREAAVDSALQVARAMAQSSSEPVLLIDADPGSPTLHRRLELPLSPGFLEMLRSGGAEPPVIHSAGRMGVMTAGSDPDPSALYASAQAGPVLEMLKRVYRWVILAGPPVLEGAEAALLGSQSDQVVLIATAERSRRGDLLAATRELNGLSVPIAGVALYHGYLSHR